MLNTSMTKLILENFKRQVDRKHITGAERMRMEVSVYSHEIRNLLADYVEWSISNEKDDLYDYMYDIILNSVDSGRREQADDISG